MAGRLAEAIGVRTMGGPFTVIIGFGTQVPMSLSRVFSTSQENQAAADFVLSAGNESGSTTRQVVRLMIPNLPPARAATLQIPITVSIDANGAVVVSAEHPASKEFLMASGGPVAVIG